jgi:hypothetical protein
MLLRELVEYRRHHEQTQRSPFTVDEIQNILQLNPNSASEEDFISGTLVFVPMFFHCYFDKNELC